MTTPSINTKLPGDSGYIAFAPQGQVEVYASSTMRARDLVCRHFKIRAHHAYKVRVILAEKSDGTPYVHTPDF